MESSDDDIADIFGKSDDEEEFGGFNFTLPANINWENDDDGSKTCQYYTANPHTVFNRNVGPAINELPGEKTAVDIFELFVDNERLEMLNGQTNGSL